jgi:hypothetical protein
MSEHVWWYAARASGIVAWLLLTGSVLWGIVLASDVFPAIVGRHGSSTSTAGWVA